MRHVEPAIQFCNENEACVAVMEFNEHLPQTHILCSRINEDPNGREWAYVKGKLYHESKEHIQNIYLL